MLPWLTAIGDTNRRGFFRLEVRFLVSLSLQSSVEGTHHYSSPFAIGFMFSSLSGPDVVWSAFVVLLRKKGGLLLKPTVRLRSPYRALSAAVIMLHDGNQADKKAMSALHLLFLGAKGRELLNLAGSNRSLGLFGGATMGDRGPEKAMCLAKKSEGRVIAMGMRLTQCASLSCGTYLITGQPRVRHGQLA